MQLLKDRFDHKAGTIVYKATKYDYCLADNDTRATGIQHISVSLKEDGDYPFFTVPITDIEEVL